MEDPKITQEIGENIKITTPPISLRRYVGLLVAAWTGVIILSLIASLYQERQADLEIARGTARSNCDQIILYRQWNALHKGVYVQVDKNTPPNPYLSSVPERDLHTPSGRKLTLVNPAYMTRQLYELAQRQNKIEGRIISLKPISPENTPDFWEIKALKALKKGAKEYSAMEQMPDEEYMRFIRPLIIDKGCLACHASQGYKEGELKGGISVLVPMEPIRAASRQQVFGIYLSHVLLWLLGLGGIALASARLNKSLTRQWQTEMDLQEANQTLGSLIKSAPLAIVALDAQGCVRLWNPAAEKIFGWEVAEVLGQPPPFLPETPAPEFLEIYFRGLGGKAVHGEGEFRNRNGMVMDISFSMSPLQDPQDGLSGVMAILEDVTERRQAEEELFKANEKLKIWILEFGRRNRDITLLNEMGDLLQACRTIEEAYAGVGQYAPQMFSEESGALFVLNKDKNVLEAVAHWGKSKVGALAFSPDECWALRMGQEHLVKEPSAGLICGHLAGSVSTCHICVPLIAHGENLGLLLLVKNPQATYSDDSLSESKTRLATTAGKQIALSLANLNLRNSLMEQAIHDPLTCLFNRRYMEEMLEREIMRVQRKEAPLGVIMGDLDHFKHFNDTFGHEAGDTLLRALSNFMKANIRGHDIACRYGGEEFLLILPETSLETTRERAEKLRRGVENLQVEYDGKPLGQITVSLGVAVFPDHGEDGESLIRSADAALYQAKAEGRNRVVVAVAANKKPAG